MRLAGKRLLACQHFIEHRPEREDIRPCVGFFPFDLLGRHVLEGAENGPLLGQRRGRRRQHRRRARGRRRATLRETEIEELGDRRPAAAQQHDVARLEVAMDDARPVRGGERVGNLDGHLQGVLEGHRPFLLQPLLERLALEILHDEKVDGRPRP